MATKKPSTAKSAAKPKKTTKAAKSPVIDTPPEPAPAQPVHGAQLNVLGQFIKDLSFESPNAPTSLQGPGENPKLEVNVNVQGRKHADDVYEVGLHFEAQAGNDTGVIYNVELVYAGLFRLTSIPENLLQPVLFIDCPAVLFPFLRRLVADLTREGGFPPLYLDPIDFASLYQQNVAQSQQQTVAS
jgi:preprotein translocase subunit SecB